MISDALITIYNFYIPQLQNSTPKSRKAAPHARLPTRPRSPSHFVTDKPVFVDPPYAALSSLHPTPPHIKTPHLTIHRSFINKPEKKTQT
jgi:hypothetical protein